MTPETPAPNQGNDGQHSDPTDTTDTAEIPAWDYADGGEVLALENGEATPVSDNHAELTVEAPTDGVDVSTRAYAVWANEYVPQIDLQLGNEPWLSLAYTMTPSEARELAAALDAAARDAERVVAAEAAYAPDNGDGEGDE